MDGELNTGLQFEEWGTGPDHAVALPAQCETCRGTGNVGRVLPIRCGDCAGKGMVFSG